MRVETGSKVQQYILESFEFFIISTSRNVVIKANLEDRYVRTERFKYFNFY